jgi:hypothetical protein
MRSTLGRDVEHRTSVYKNNRLEQDHRGLLPAIGGVEFLAEPGHGTVEIPVEVPACAERSCDAPARHRP